MIGKEKVKPKSYFFLQVKIIQFYRNVKDLGSDTTKNSEVGISI